MPESLAGSGSTEMEHEALFASRDVDTVILMILGIRYLPNYSAPRALLAQRTPLLIFSDAIAEDSGG